jgi:hypothetical protein
MMISYLYVVILYYIVPRWVLPAGFFSRAGVGMEQNVYSGAGAGAGGG